jgi:rhodanese-related sulfurtransferase
MSPADLLARIRAGTAPVILDVRSRGEFDAGHVPGAIHIPFWNVSGRLAEIPGAKSDPVVVYCGHGPRAWIAGAALKRRGFTNVTYLDGHMSGWQEAKLPLVKPDTTKAQ